MILEFCFREKCTAWGTTKGQLQQPLHWRQAELYSRVPTDSKIRKLQKYSSWSLTESKFYIRLWNLPPKSINLNYRLLKTTRMNFINVLSDWKTCLIHRTDSREKHLLEEKVNLLRRSGVTIFPVGIGRRVDENELKVSSLVFKVSSKVIRSFIYFHS